MKCFYHSADLDGHCSGAIVKYFRSDCELIPINYADLFPFDIIQANETIYMVDFSLPFEQMARLRSITENLIWIDHHETAIQEHILWEKERGKISIQGKQHVKFAACELCWHHFIAPDDDVRESLPKAIHFIGRYDLHDKSNVDEWYESIVPFHYGMLSRETDPRTTLSLTTLDGFPRNAPYQNLWEPLFKHNEVTLEGIRREGEAIIRFLKKMTPQGNLVQE